MLVGLATSSSMLVPTRHITYAASMIGEQGARPTTDDKHSLGEILEIHLQGLDYQRRCL